MTEAVARANSNIPLIQSWGTRNRELGLPYTGAVSLTLDGPTSTVRWSNAAAFTADRVTINGRPATGSVAERLFAFAQHLRRQFGGRAHSLVDVALDDPTREHADATLAAAALAGSAAWGVRLARRELSMLARRAAPAAAPSVFGGFVELHSGELDDGSDCFAEPLAGAGDWPLALVTALVAAPPGAVALPDRGEAIKRSPFFPAWLARGDDDEEALRAAVLHRDLAQLGQVMEANCLQAHAVAMAARPSLFAWRPATLAVVERVRLLRARGVAAYFTVGTEPHVGVLCGAADAELVADALGEVTGVEHIRRAAPGAGAELVEPA